MNNAAGNGMRDMENALHNVLMTFPSVQSAYSGKCV